MSATIAAAALGVLGIIGGMAIGTLTSLRRREDAPAGALAAVACCAMVCVVGVVLALVLTS